MEATRGYESPYVIISISNTGQYRTWTITLADNQGQCPRCEACEKLHVVYNGRERHRCQHDVSAHGLDRNSRTNDLRNLRFIWRDGNDRDVDVAGGPDEVLSIQILAVCLRAGNKGCIDVGD